MVDVQTYVPMIDAILSASDPDKVTPKRIRRALQELFGVNLDSQRKDVNQLIIVRFQEIQKRPRVLVTQEELIKKDEKLAQQLQKGEDAGSKRSRDSSRPKSKTKKRRKTDGSTPSSNNSLAARKVMLAKPLSEFLGETMLSRTQVVKQVWDYIKKHDLQNPQDRREILCDDKMQPIFGKKMTMFSMNKILSGFLYNADEINSGTASPIPKADSPDESGELGNELEASTE